MSYQDLYSTVKARYANDKAPYHQQKTNEIWKELKKTYTNKKNLEFHTQEKIRDLKKEISTPEAEATLLY